MIPVAQIDPTRVVLPSGELNLAMLLAISALVVILGMLVWAARDAMHDRGHARGRTDRTTPGARAVR
jgi:hypothetical protein